MIFSDIDGFKCPVVRAKAALLYQEIKNHPDRYRSRQILDRLGKLVREEGEWTFEQDTRYHPYGVEPKSFDDQKELDIKEWLVRNVMPEDYLFMGPGAIGKYMDRWNWAFFRHRRDAALFKLTWG